MDRICSTVSETLIEYHKQCEERESATWEGLLLNRNVLPSSSIRNEELTQQNICHPSPALASAEGGELRGARRPPPHNKPHFQMLPAAHWINIFPRQGREEGRALFHCRDHLSLSFHPGRPASWPCARPPSSHLVSATSIVCEDRISNGHVRANERDQHQRRGQREGRGLQQGHVRDTDMRLGNV